MHNRLRLLPSTVPLRLLQLKPAILREYEDSFLYGKQLKVEVLQKLFAVGSPHIKEDLVNRVRLVDPLMEREVAIDYRTLSSTHFGWLLRKKWTLAQGLELLCSQKSPGFMRALIWNNPALQEALVQEAKHNPAALEVLENPSVCAKYHLQQKPLAELLQDYPDHVDALLQAAIEQGVVIGPAEIEALQLGDTLSDKAIHWLERLFGRGIAWWVVEQYLPGGLHPLLMAKSKLAAAKEEVENRRALLPPYSWDRDTNHNQEGILQDEYKAVKAEKDRLEEAPVCLLAAAIAHYQQYDLLACLVDVNEDWAQAVMYLASHFPNPAVKKLVKALHEGPLSNQPTRTHCLYEVVVSYLDNPHFKAKVFGFALEALKANYQGGILGMDYFMVLADHNCTLEAYEFFMDWALEEKAPIRMLKKDFWQLAWQEYPTLTSGLVDKMWFEGPEALRKEMSNSPSFSWETLLQNALPIGKNTLCLLKHPQMNRDVLLSLCRELFDAVNYPNHPDLQEVIEAMYYHPLSDAQIKAQINRAINQNAR